MPKVDPKSGQPVSDDPEQESDDLRGGKSIGDPATDEGAPNGRPGLFGQNKTKNKS